MHSKGTILLLQASVGFDLPMISVQIFPEQNSEQFFPAQKVSLRADGSFLSPFALLCLCTPMQRAPYTQGVRQSTWSPAQCSPKAGFSRSAGGIYKNLPPSLLFQTPVPPAGWCYKYRRPQEIHRLCEPLAAPSRLKVARSGLCLPQS